MSSLVRDPTDELVLFSVPPQVLALPPDLRDDYCYWPMVSAILAQDPVAPLGPVQNPSYQFMTQPEDAERIDLRHPCAGCRGAVQEAAAALERVEPGSLTICVAQCVVVYLRDISMLNGRFTPLMRTSDQL